MTAPPGKPQAERAARHRAALRAALGREPQVQVQRHGSEAGWRSYEIYQRERVGESTERLKASDFVSGAFVADPYPTLTILREHYPCYRNWLTNDYWITRYDDVTSVFTDDANYATRPRCWFLGQPDLGRDLGDQLPVLAAWARAVDALVGPISTELAQELASAGGGDLARFAARLPLELLARALDLPAADHGLFAERYWRMQLGVGWEPRAQVAGQRALNELLAYFGPLVAMRRADPGEDLLSAMVTLDLDDGPVTAGDVVATLLEQDHQTLHGGLANQWLALLRDPDQFEQARADARLMKLAWLETLRHAPPVQTAQRFARHEVERFGRLLPAGALLRCSAAAAGRDPRVFERPEQFDPARKDLCQREPRGQYRADGLCSGISFGTGKPSRHPAVPEDRPRSRYALTRDAALTASWTLVGICGRMRLADGAEPHMTALRVGEMYTCWQLPVTCQG